MTRAALLHQSPAGPATGVADTWPAGGEARGMTGAGRETEARPGMRKGGRWRREEKAKADERRMSFLMDESGGRW